MKIAFLHAVDYLEIGIPQGISLLAAIVKEHGHDVKVIDTTFMKTSDYKRPKAGPTIYKKTAYDIHDLVKDDYEVNVVQEIQRQIDEYAPDLFAVSVMTTNYQYSVDLMEKLDVKCTVIYGGVHPTICPEEVLAKEFVDIVCVGEGDIALPKLCDAIERKEDYFQIPNLWIKRKIDGNITIIRNPQGKFVDLNTLPVPDWSLFDQRHLFRPYDGEIYTGGFFVSSRGCPGKCTYCVNEVLQGICKDCGAYFRRMSPRKIAEQVKFLKETYGATWFKFGDDTFLLHTVAEFEELRDLIKPLNIMFGCSVRPDTVTEKKVKLLKEMGCVAMSVGVETGNERLRRDSLNRQISNKQIENALYWIDKEGIRISTFNLLGIPGEKREDVYETIRLNKKLNVKAANVYILYPFPGTVIYKKYKPNIIDAEGKIIPMEKAEKFKFSMMTQDDLVGLQKTFNLYLALPETLWPIIRLAEKDDAQGKIIYDSLNDFAISRL